MLDGPLLAASVAVAVVSLGGELYPSLITLSALGHTRARLLWQHNGRVLFAFYLQADSLIYLSKAAPQARRLFYLATHERVRRRH